MSWLTYEKTIELPIDDNDYGYMYPYIDKETHRDKTIHYFHNYNNDHSSAAAMSRYYVRARDKYKYDKVYNDMINFKNNGSDIKSILGVRLDGFYGGVNRYLKRLAVMNYYRIYILNDINNNAYHAGEYTRKSTSEEYGSNKKLIHNLRLISNPQKAITIPEYILGSYFKRNEISTKQELMNKNKKYSQSFGLISTKGGYYIVLCDYGDNVFNNMNIIKINKSNELRKIPSNICKIKYNEKYDEIYGVGVDSLTNKISISILKNDFDKINHKLKSPDDLFIYNAYEFDKRILNIDTDEMSEKPFSDGVAIDIFEATNHNNTDNKTIMVSISNKNNKPDQFKSTTISLLANNIKDDGNSTKYIKNMSDSYPIYQTKKSFIVVNTSSQIPTIGICRKKYSDDGLVYFDEFDENYTRIELRNKPVNNNSSHFMDYIDGKIYICTGIKTYDVYSIDLHAFAFEEDPIPVNFIQIDEYRNNKVILKSYMESSFIVRLNDKIVNFLEDNPDNRYSIHPPIGYEKLGNSSGDYYTGTYCFKEIVDRFYHNIANRIAILLKRVDGLSGEKITIIRSTFYENPGILYLNGGVNLYRSSRFKDDIPYTAIKIKYDNGDLSEWMDYIGGGASKLVFSYKNMPLGCKKIYVESKEKYADYINESYLPEKERSRYYKNAEFDVDNNIYILNEDGTEEIDDTKPILILDKKTTHKFTIKNNLYGSNFTNVTLNPIYNKNQIDSIEVTGNGPMKYGESRVITVKINKKDNVKSAEFGLDLLCYEK